MYMSNLIVAGHKCTDPLCDVSVPKYDFGASAPSLLETGTEWFYGDKTTLMDEIYDEISLEEGTRSTSKFRLLSLYNNTFFHYDGFSGYCGITPTGNTVNNFASIVGFFYENGYIRKNQFMIIEGKEIAFGHYDDTMIGASRDTSQEIDENIVWTSLYA